MLVVDKWWKGEENSDAWHATYENVLVLEWRHGSEVSGPDGVHLLYPRVLRALRGQKCALPAREGPCVTSPDPKPTITT